MQTQSLEVFVPIENFDSRAYVLANHDLSNYTEAEALRHYRNHGVHENRKQINPVLLDRKSSYRQEKFLRFAPRIDEISDEDVSFPIRTGSQHHDIGKYLTESANDDFGPFVGDVDCNPDKLYLDLGCGLRKKLRVNCLYLEVYASVTADVIVEPSCRYPIKDATFDGIGCFSVLEHTRKPWVVVEEIRRMLKPGGKVWIDWPFLAPLHGYPSHFFNATREGLRSLFEDNGFAVDDIGTWPHQGPDWMFHWALSVLAHNLPEEGRNMLRATTVGELIDARPLTGIWSDLMRQIDDRTRSTLGAGNSLVATKK